MFQQNPGKSSVLRLEEDCPATVIPAGHEVILPAGRDYAVMQTLGGSVTLRDNDGLYRVAPENLGLLGEEVSALVQAESGGSLDPAEGEFSEAMVWDALKGCFDPEIPVNIVDLGLIYDLHLENTGEDRFNVAVKMTLTAPGCGMGTVIAEDARRRIEAIPAVNQAMVDIVWDPQWTPHMISDEGRKILGLT